MLTRSARARGMAVAAVLGMVLAWGGVTEVATAALITFHFEGKVTSVDPGLSAWFSTSDKFTGSYSFHSDAPDRLPGESERGNYALTQLAYTVGGFAFTADGRHFQGPPSLAIHNDGDFSTYFAAPAPVIADSYGISGYEGEPHGPFLGQLYAQAFNLDIIGRNLFQNDSLPLTPPSLGNLLQGTLAVYFAEAGNPYVFAELTSLTLAPVPVPGAILLFGSGVLGLAAFKRLRRTRQA